MNNKQKSELVELYNATSKHSNYQILPSILKDMLPMEELIIKSRYEEERLEYIMKNVDFHDKVFCDIGANCGYFSFELINRGAKFVKMYEGNEKHAQFVNKAIDILELSDRMCINNLYFDFEHMDEKHDIVLLLNVLHHIGDDYGAVTNIADAKQRMLDSINNMSKNTDVLILQIGFNWMGNIKKGLFEKGTKREMIEWLQKGISNCWNIKKIGIAESVEGKILYKDMNQFNIERKDELGEFLNRPIFILEAIGK